MLIEFSVTNFCQFLGKQTLSMVADNTKELQDSNTFLPIPKSEKVKLARLIKSTGIYGPNASGKSNLLLAMNLMKDIILVSNFSNKLDKIVPHVIHQNESTEFEIIFINDGVRYQYGFAVKNQIIIEEWLFAFPNGRAQQWVSRVYIEETQKYSWYISPSFVKGNKKEIVKNISEYQLFLSVMIKSDNDPFKPLYQWFDININCVDDKYSIVNDIIFWKKFPEKKKFVLNFLKAVDMEDIEDIYIEHYMPKDLNYFVHNIICSYKNFKIPFESESKGTQQIIRLALNISNVLENGSVLCIDDLGKNLHPYISNLLVTVFNDSEINPNNAQLIFTSHDTTLLNNDLLRRDQVWFITKDDDCNSHLYPLTDYKPRNNESLQKGYLQGHYSAVPYVSISQLFK